MNLHKFRQVKPDFQTPEAQNPEYINHLASLGQKRSHAALFASVGTVAACLLLLAAVVIWSAIGKNVRDGDGDIADLPPASEQAPEITVVPGTEVEYTVDEDAKSRFAIDIGVGHGIYQIPYFDKDNPPAVFDMANRMATVGISKQYAEYLPYIPGDKINEYTKKWFGVEIADNDFKYGAWSDMGDYMGPDLISMSSVQLSDGSTQYTAYYMAAPDWYVTLVYIGEMYAPTRFVSHVREGYALENDTKDKLFSTIKKELESAEFMGDFVFCIDEFWIKEDGNINFALGITACFNDGRPHAFFGGKPTVSPSWQYYTYTRGMTAIFTDDNLIIGYEKQGFNSAIYSDEDIADAMAASLAEFEKMMKDYDYRLEGIYYYKCDELVPLYKEHAKRNNADEVIVIKSSFTTFGPAPAGLNEFEDYEEYMWILVRNKGGDWRVVDRGY